jgi:hypothetical protein
MDPDACLKEIREIKKEILCGNVILADMEHVSDRLAELIDTLDYWITRGGFLPKDWWCNRV